VNQREKDARYFMRVLRAKKANNYSIDVKLVP
jgi:hypothetical protein